MTIVRRSWGLCPVYKLIREICVLDVLFATTGRLDFGFGECAKYRGMYECTMPPEGLEAMTKNVFYFDQEILGVIVLAR